MSQPELSVSLIVRDLAWKHEIFLHGPDCFHLGTAIKEKCEELITTDSKDIIAAAAKILPLGVRVIEAGASKYLPATAPQMALEFPASER